MIIAVIVLCLVLGIVLVCHYFYNLGIKRGKTVEIYSGKKVVETFTSEQNQRLLDEATSWYKAHTPQELKLDSYDGTKLKAKFFKNRLGAKKAVILAHGYRSTNEEMSKLVKFYYDLGFDILMPDARGHGKSEGSYIGYGWHDRIDCLKWIDLLIQEKKTKDILLHGNSMGATLVLMASGEDLPDEVKGIIADSGYTSVIDQLTYQLKHLYKLPPFPLMQITSLITKFRAGFTFNEASAIKQVQKNRLPLFIIHGAEDYLVPTDMAYQLYDAAREQSQLWIVPGAGHTKAYTLVTKEYQFRLSQFINHCIVSKNKDEAK